MPATADELSIPSRHSIAKRRLSPSCPFITSNDRSRPLSKAAMQYNFPLDCPATLRFGEGIRAWRPLWTPQLPPEFPEPSKRGGAPSCAREPPPLTAYQCLIAMCSPKDGSQDSANSSRTNLGESANLRPSSAKRSPAPRGTRARAILNRQSSGRLSNKIVHRGTCAFVAQQLLHLTPFHGLAYIRIRVVQISPESSVTDAILHTSRHFA